MKTIILVVTLNYHPVERLPSDEVQTFIYLVPDSGLIQMHFHKWTEDEIRDLAEFILRSEVGDFEYSYEPLDSLESGFMDVDFDVTEEEKELITLPGQTELNSFWFSVSNSGGLEGSADDSVDDSQDSEAVPSLAVLPYPPLAVDLIYSLP